MITKIKLCITAGIAVVIISLMVFIGFQYIHIQGLEKNVYDLKIENSVLTLSVYRRTKDNLFFVKQIEIQNQFANSTTTINEITNDIIFSPTGAQTCSNKQIAINEIIKDYYKQINK